MMQFEYTLVNYSPGKFPIYARFTFHVSRITHHASRITYHVSRITHHASRITYHASRITYHVSRITYHASRITFHDPPRLHCRSPTGMVLQINAYGRKVQ